MEKMANTQTNGEKDRALCKRVYSNKIACCS